MNKNNLNKYVKYAQQRYFQFMDHEIEPIVAAYVLQDRNNGALALLELFEGFGGNDISSKRELFWVSYMDGLTEIFHYFSSPHEFAVAKKENWDFFDRFKVKYVLKKSGDSYEI